MKNIVFVLACIALCVLSCKKKAEPEPEPASTTTTTGNPVGTTTGATVNTGPLSLYLVDSVKLNAVTETGQETTLLSPGNYMDFSPAVNNTKLVYRSQQGIYMADPNGSNIQQVCTIPGTSNFMGIRAGVNNKIYYACYQNANNNLYSVNTDGTGQVLLFSDQMAFRGIAPDGSHVACLSIDTLVVLNTSGPLNRRKIPLGSLSGGYSYLSPPGFSYDSHKVTASYGVGDTLMLKVFDIATAALTTRSVTVIPNSAGNIESNTYMASDGDRIVITVRTASNALCYIYRMSTRTLITNFVLNNDAVVHGIYAF